MDKDRINSILGDIDKYLKELEGYNIKNLEDLSDSKKYYASSMLLFGIFNKVIGLGQDLLLVKSLGTPITYNDIFDILGKAKLINKELSLELQKMVKIRNNLAHEYFSFSEKDVFEGIKKIRFVKEFIKIVLRVE